MKKPCRPADICAHLGDDYDRYLGAIVPPLFQNTLFTRKHEEHGYSYSRINNPTIEILEKKLAALEHAPAARVFASGMAAITATLSSLLHSGGHVLALRSAYHPVIGFLDTEMKKYGVEVTYLERFTPEEIERSLRPNTRVFYLESPSSNIFRVLPLREIAAQAHACGAVTVIDNTWATPLYQKPLELGIDYSIHSATKYLGGHSDVLGGVVLGSEERMDALRGGQRASWGACMDPFAAWLLIRSHRTKPEEKAAAEELPVIKAETPDEVLCVCIGEVCTTMEQVTRIYNRTLVAVFKENRKVLKEMVQSSNRLFEEARDRKYGIMPTLRRLQQCDIDTGHFYVQVTDYLSEVTKALIHITRPAFGHIDNNHEGLSKEQIVDLMRVNDQVEAIFDKINDMLRTKDFSDLDMVLEMRDKLFDTIVEAIKNQLRRINGDPAASTRASVLYLTILNETKTMILQARNLLKSQHYFLESRK